MTALQSHGNTRHRASFPAVMPAIALAILAIALPSGAKDLQSYGGKGGDASYRLECPPGTLLTGFVGQAGRQISQMSIECRRYDSQRGYLGDAVGPLSDSQGSLVAGRASGGTQRRKACASQQAIYTVDFIFARSGPTALDWLRAGCMDAADSRRPATSFDFPDSDAGQSGDSSSNYPHSGWQICPQGELPSGIHGTSRLYVDSIGLICRPAARGSSTPEQDSHGVYLWPFAAPPADSRRADGH